MDLVRVSCAFLFFLISFKSSQSLECYSCDSSPLIGEPNSECHNLTDDKYLQDFTASDPPDDQEFGYWRYCVIQMGQREGSPWTYRSTVLLTDSTSDGKCEETESWMGQYKTCYCRSDKCNGGSVDDFGNDGQSPTPAPAPIAEHEKTAGIPTSEDSKLECYQCSTYPAMPLYPDTPGCDVSPKEDYLKPAPTMDYGDIHTFCTIRMYREGDVVHTERAIASRTLDFDGKCDVEKTNGQIRDKMCYCRTSGCNNGTITLEDEGVTTPAAPTTSSPIATDKDDVTPRVSTSKTADPSTGAITPSTTAYSSSTTKTVPTSFTSPAPTPSTSVRTTPGVPASTVADGNNASGSSCHCNQQYSEDFYSYANSLLFVHFTLVACSICVAIYSLYMVAKYKQLMQLSMRQTSAWEKPCYDQKVPRLPA